MGRGSGSGFSVLSSVVVVAAFLATLLLASLYAGPDAASAAPGPSATNTPNPGGGSGNSGRGSGTSNLAPTATPVPPTATLVPPGAPTSTLVPQGLVATATSTVVGAGAPTATATATAAVAATATPTATLPVGATGTATPTVAAAGTATPTAVVPTLITATPTATLVPPPNDDYNAATSIATFPFTASMDTQGATVASDDPDLGLDPGLIGNTVWWRLVAPSAGRLQVDTFGSDYDTVLAAFTGARGALRMVADNDDAASPPQSDLARQSQIDFDVQAGEAYFLALASYGFGGGMASLRVEFTPGATAATPTPTATIAATATLVPATVVPQTTPGASTSGFAPDPVSRATAADERYFDETGFRVDRDAFWDYFQKRGGVRTFGYPVSRELRLLGFPAQFFQRGILQLMPDGGVAMMNLLDAGLMPYTHINFSAFPRPDRELIDAAPSVKDPDYADKALAFVRANVVDEWEGMPVDFLRTFFSTVRQEDAFPRGEGEPALVALMNLEVWGFPTSKPVRDPNNHNFVYQRFQRGILHFDAATGATEGILLADYLKSVMTGRDLPPDLEEEARGSRFYRQYDPSRPNSVARPSALPNTRLMGAFE